MTRWCSISGRTGTKQTSLPRRLTRYLARITGSAYLDNLALLVEESLMQLRANKMRSFLSLLGILFGVASMIAMMAIGTGAQHEISRALQLLGVNSFYIEPVALSRDEQENSVNKSQGLTQRDANALDAMLPAVHATPVLQVPYTDIFPKPGKKPDNVLGVYPAFFQYLGFSLRCGRSFTAGDILHRARVCIIGSGLQTQLFGYKAPVGQILRLDNDLFTVVGVLQQRETLDKEMAPDYDIDDYNRTIYIPFSVADRLRRGGNGQLQQIVVHNLGRYDMRALSAVFSRAMRRLHHHVPDYTLVLPHDLLKQKKQAQQTFNLVMVSIAGISLLIGGIGIMNIMIATVLERRKEIGIRRAIGATQGDIKLQFMLEALVICLVGGLAGIAMGIVLALIISLYTGWQVAISIPAICLALGVSLVTGLVFGISPAKRAAAMNPIDSIGSL